MIGERLRSLRLKNSYTQQNMADMLGISLNGYQKYEINMRRPTFEGLVQLADILNVPTDYLLGRDDFLKALGVSVDEYQ